MALKGQTKKENTKGLAIRGDRIFPRTKLREDPIPALNKCSFFPSFFSMKLEIYKCFFFFFISFYKYFSSSIQMFLIM